MIIYVLVNLFYIWHNKMLYIIVTLSSQLTNALAIELYASSKETHNVDGSVMFFLCICWTGRKWPSKDPQKTTVIWHLSFKPATSTRHAPFCSIVQPFDSTNFIPVWSQLRTNSDGISSIITVVRISIKKDSLSCKNQQHCFCSLTLLLFF